MRKAVTLLFLSILPACMTVGEQPETVRGSVCGSVLDENGLPASRVRVVAMDKNHQSGGFPYAVTDASGSYCIKGLRLGEWVLSAWDETRGYPHRGPLFYSWQTPDPKVELTLLNPAARANWQIPFKAGFVKIQAPQAHTGSQSDRISIFFQVRSKPQGASTGASIQAGSLFTFLLPPDEDVLLTVTCADGKKWPYDSDEGKLLHLSSGETENITLPTSCVEKVM